MLSVSSFPMIYALLAKEEQLSFDIQKNYACHILSATTLSLATACPYEDQRGNGWWIRCIGLKEPSSTWVGTPGDFTQYQLLFSFYVGPMSGHFQLVDLFGDP